MAWMCWACSVRYAEKGDLRRIEESGARPRFAHARGDEEACRTEVKESFIELLADLDRHPGHRADDRQPDLSGMRVAGEHQIDAAGLGQGRSIGIVHREDGRHAGRGAAERGIDVGISEADVVEARKEDLSPV